MKCSIQLYSLKNLVTDGASFLALFPKLKALGFDGVEFAGFHSLAPEEIRRALDEHGLTASGAHMGLDDLRPERLPHTLALCNTLGLRTVGIGGAPHSSIKETEASCAVLAEAYAAALPQGVTVYYHNHMEEFKRLKDGSQPIDRFLAACPLEFDAYWGFAAGLDPYQFITEHKERIAHVHIKDGIPAGKKMTALGEGECCLDAVVRGAKAIGLEWLTLEDESWNGMKSIETGAAWLAAHAK